MMKEEEKELEDVEFDEAEYPEDYAEQIIESEAEKFSYADAMKRRTSFCNKADVSFLPQQISWNWRDTIKWGMSKI